MATTIAQDDLTNLRKLVSKKGSWTYGAAARDSRNRPCSFEAADACKFCIIGGLARVCKGVDARFDIAKEFIVDAIFEITGEEDSIANFNDTNSYKTVVAVLDRAIQLAA